MVSDIKCDKFLKWNVLETLNKSINFTTPEFYPSDIGDPKKGKTKVITVSFDHIKNV